MITGTNLDGDNPEYKKLCIAPEYAKDQKECYYDFQLDGIQWSDGKISFYPPEKLPTRGVVILQLDEDVEKCFGSAGCSTYSEDVEKEIGSFTVVPHITEVIAGNTLSGVKATAIEAGRSYQITGMYFGEAKGKIFIRQPRGSKEVPSDKITSWTEKSILFSAPVDIEAGNGVSVNNFGTAQWYDLPKATAASSSSKSRSTDPVKRIEEIEGEIDDLNQDFAERWGGEHNGEAYVGTENQAFAKQILKIFQDSQATIDKYGSNVQQVGNACMSLNDKENTRECQSVCANKTEEIVRNACENIGSTDISACMETGKQYKSVQDNEKECVTSCLKLCVAGTECVCQDGRVNKNAYRDLDMAKRNLVSGYKTLYEDPTADKYRLEAIKQELEKNGLNLVKNGDDVMLVSGNGGQSAGEGMFSDIGKGHPYSSAIEWAKQSGILQGYPDGSFKPDNTVNRAEFLKIVLVAKGSDTGASGTSGFHDVNDNAWYAPYVRYAKASGIVQGYPDGSFKPEQAVNFAEALKMAYNALGVSTAELDGEWYERFLRHAQKNNVLYSSNPNVGEGMSRKDVVWIVWKVMTHTGAWQQPEGVRKQESSSARSTTTNTSNAIPASSELNEDTETVIKAHCSEEWSSDYEMRAYCEKNQREAVKTLNLSKPSDITNEQFSVIRSGCKEDWPTDYEMRAYCEKNQFGGVRDVGESRPSGIGETEYQIIKAECLEDWPNDFEMQAYCEDNQYDAVRTLDATNTSASVRSKCASEWPRDYEMKVYCEKQ